MEGKQLLVSSVDSVREGAGGKGVREGASEEEGCSVCAVCISGDSCLCCSNVRVSWSLSVRILSSLSVTSPGSEQVQIIRWFSNPAQPTPCFDSVLAVRKSSSFFQASGCR